jgi:hypothetical protein
VAYRSTYVPNRNPAVPTVTVMSGPTPSLPDASSPTGGAATLVEGIAPGSALAFRVAWPDSSKESFVAFDPGTQSLGTQTEDLRVSYFGTGGSWAHDHLGRRGDDGVHFVDNTWTAPREPGRFFLWFVLRDSRGGVSFAQVTIQLTP